MCRREPSKSKRETSRRDFLKASAALTVAASWTSQSAARARTDAGDEETFDYIVIGAGSSGCVVANRLSEDDQTRVFLLEAGGPDKKPQIHAPAAFWDLQGSEVDWKYATEPEPNLDNRRIPWPRGKVLGGCSSINAMLYIRGHRLDYDHWNYLGNEGWSYDDVLPLFTRSENNQRGASAFQGGEGLLSVIDNPHPTLVALACIEAVGELGLQGKPDWDFNGAKQEDGAGLFQLNIKDGKRHSAAAAFLTPFLSRTNLVARPWAEVNRLLWQRNRTVGIEYTQDGKLRRARATREVVVCAGAIDSPQLLMLSGIGPAAHLREHGIDAVVDLPGVGANLQDHAYSLVGYRSKRELPPRYASGAEVGMFVRTRARIDASSPDLQFHVGHDLFEPRGWFGFGPTLVRPQSRGSIQLRSANPSDPPVIRANYLQSEADLDVLVAGFKLARQWAHARALDDLRGEEFTPGPAVQSDAQIRQYFRASLTTIYHPVGTCKMGRDRMAVVDPQLRVQGVEGLRVADASIMPTIVNGNTHAPCVMIGEKAAELIKAQGA